MAEVEAQAEQHVGVLERRQVGALQQRLVHVDRAADLPLLPVQVAENHLDLERVGVGAGRLGQLVDRLIDLVVDQEVEPEHVVRRLAQPPAIDPAAVAQLVALPGLADDQPDQQREAGRRGAEGSDSCCDCEVAAGQIISVRQRSCRWTTPCTFCVAVDDDDRRDLALFEDVAALRRPACRGAMVTGLRVMTSAAVALEQVRACRPCAAAGRRR